MDFSHIRPAPPDPILGLTEAFLRDPNPHKVNLGVGVYKDEQGRTPVFAAVKEAENRLLHKETSKSYLPITGLAAYNDLVQSLFIPESLRATWADRIITAQTPGGTAALRVAADFLRRHVPQATVWISDPTWENHAAIFQSVGLCTARYPYYDPSSNGLHFEALCETLRNLTPNDVVLLHVCCHNPTGVDPTPAQWNTLADIAAERGFLPLFDFAYQGLAEGLEEDARPLITFLTRVPSVWICSSFSKNFGLYNERVGAFTALCPSPHETATILSQLKVCIRTLYSNPPAHGAAVVAEILTDNTLRSVWEEELTRMRRRIQAMRSALAQNLHDHGAPWDFAFIKHQRGMFSFSGLRPEHVRRLREQYSIYIVESGRINVAGITPENLPYLTEAIVSVLKALG